MKKILFLAGILFFLSTTPILAASLTLLGTQTSLTVSDDFTVNTTLSIGAADGTAYFLRGVFYQASGAYCGFTWNGSNWYDGPYTVNNGWQQLLPVTITNGTWSGELKARIDPSDTNCQKSGVYNFKIERYTTSGSGIFDDQNELTVTLSVPTPTFTPTPTQKPTPTAKPTHVPTSTPTPRVSFSPTMSVSEDVFSPTDEGFVLADSDSEVASQAETASDPALLLPTVSISPTKILVKGQQKAKKSGLPGMLFILGGSICLIGCGILLFLMRKNKL